MPYTTHYIICTIWCGGKPSYCATSRISYCAKMPSHPQRLLFLLHRLRSPPARPITSSPYCNTAMHAKLYMAADLCCAAPTQRPAHNISHLVAGHQRQELAAHHLDKLV